MYTSLSLSIYIYIYTHIIIYIYIYMYIFIQNLRRGQALQGQEPPAAEVRAGVLRVDIQHINIISCLRILSRTVVSTHMEAGELDNF